MYTVAFQVSPKSNDFNVVQYLYDTLIKMNIIPNVYHIEDAIIYSFSQGRIDIVEWLITLTNYSIDFQDTQDRLLNSSFVSTIDECNLMDIVKWLHNKNIVKFTRDTMDKAAQYGHLEFIKWCHYNRTEGCTSFAIDNAAWNGHLETIKWLHKNRTEGCTTDAMNYAAYSGLLETIKWLHYNRSEGCTTYAMDKAASNGHLEIVIWLHEIKLQILINLSTM